MSITRWPDPARVVAVALLALLVACSSDLPADGAGTQVSEQRGVDAFHSIDLRGATDATVQVGSPGALTLTGDADAVAAIQSRVQNGMLIIENKPGLHWLGNSARVEARITLPELNALSMNGAGNVSITGVAGPALALALQGAGNLKASGRTVALNARINGAGNIDLAHLVATDATLVVNGAGNLSAHVEGSLQASVNGVGSITYAGKPREVDSSIHGVGRIVPEPEPGT